MAYPYVQSATDLGPAKGPRLAITWHMAEGGGTVGFLSKPNPNGVSVHFVIQYTGVIVQMLPLNHMQSSIRTSDIRTSDDPPYGNPPVTYGRTAALAVMGTWADIAHGTLGPNHASIGVEMEGFAAAGPNAKQSAAIGALWADMSAKFPGIRSLGHRDFQNYKACPGKLIPWNIAGGHGAQSAEEDDVIVPQQLAHIKVTSTECHLFSAPDLGAQLPTVLPLGSVWRKFGGVPGWQMVQVGYGQPSVQSYVWVKSDAVAADPLPLTVIDGTCPDGDVTHTVTLNVDGATKATVTV